MPGNAEGFFNGAGSVVAACSFCCNRCSQVSRGGARLSHFCRKGNAQPNQTVRRKKARKQ
jgi:hypothetical protein